MAGDTPDQMLQAQLFGQRRAFYMAQLQNFDQQIAYQSAALVASKNQEAVLNDRRDGLSQIEAARERLYDNQSGSLITLLGSRDARLDVESDLTAVRGRADEAAHAYAKLRADRQAFIEDFRRAAMEQLVELRGQRDMADEELKKMALRRNMVVLTAPADSVVLDLAQRSVGSVVREAEPVVTLVPINVPLEAEVSINTRDIGRVAVGKEARIKLDAYPFQKYGTATGEVRTISQDTFLTGQQEQTATPGQPNRSLFQGADPACRYPAECHRCAGATASRHDCDHRNQGRQPHGDLLFPVSAAAWPRQRNTRTVGRDGSVRPERDPE